MSTFAGSDHRVLRLLGLASLVLVLVSLGLPGASSTAVAAEPGAGKGQHRPIHPAPVALPQVASKSLGRAAKDPPSRHVGPQFSGDHSIAPIDIKLLVIAPVDNPDDTPPNRNETNLATIRTFLRQVGIPFDVVIASQDTHDPATLKSKLWDGGIHAYYQGVILTQSSLLYQDPSSGNKL